MTTDYIQQFRKWFGHGKPGHLHGLLAEDYFKEIETWINETISQVQAEERKYIGKQKREWYIKGFSEGKAEERERIREEILHLKTYKKNWKLYYDADEIHEALSTTGKDINVPTTEGEEKCGEHGIDNCGECEPER